MPERCERVYMSDRARNRRRRNIEVGVSLALTTAFIVLVATLGLK